MGRIEGWQHKSLHKQQSMIIVPMEAPGIKVVRPLSVLSSYDAPGIIQLSQRFILYFRRSLRSVV